jgi:hypothetical protein
MAFCRQRHRPGRAQARAPQSLTQNPTRLINALRNGPAAVVAGLVPAIHVFLVARPCFGHVEKKPVAGSRRSITQARDEALRILKDNPKLIGERGKALRCLLYLCEREALPLIGAAQVTRRVTDAVMVRRRTCAVSNREDEQTSSFETRAKARSSESDRKCDESYQRFEDGSFRRRGRACPPSRKYPAWGTNPGMTNSGESAHFIDRILSQTLRSIAKRCVSKDGPRSPWFDPRPPA